jgi:Fe-S-cluster containining protein
VSPTPLWGEPPARRILTAAEAAALVAVYAEVGAALVGTGSACRACGKCCRFTPDGIVLFATALELAYLAGDERIPLEGCTSGPGSAWKCPYQQGTLCGARDHRPLGCRTYFCDYEARGAGEAAAVEAVNRIRRLAQEADLAWYGPAEVCLSSWPCDGR